MQLRRKRRAVTKGLPPARAEANDELARRIERIGSQARMVLLEEHEASAFIRGYALATFKQMLEHNIAYEGDVRGRQRSKGNLKPNAPSVSDDQVRTAVGNGGTREEQAKRLGIGVRQLHRRLMEIGNKK